jgi:hypothetical protein
MLEQRRRNARANHRAMQRLANAHPRERSVYYQEERERIYAECGPLPGDET